MKLHAFKLKVNQLDLDGNFIKQYISLTEAALATNSSIAKISTVCSKREGRIKHNGFKWEYVNKINCRNSVAESTSVEENM